MRAWTPATSRSHCQPVFHLPFSFVTSVVGSTILCFMIMIGLLRRGQAYTMPTAQLWERQLGGNLWYTSINPGDLLASRSFHDR